MTNHSPKYYKWNFWCWISGEHRWNHITDYKRECSRCYKCEVKVYNRILNRMYSWMDLTIFKREKK